LPSLRVGATSESQITSPVLAVIASTRPSSFETYRRSPSMAGRWRRPRLALSSPSLRDQALLTAIGLAISTSSAGSLALFLSSPNQPLRVVQPVVDASNAARIRVRRSMRSGLRGIGQAAAGRGELHFDDAAGRRRQV